MSSEHVLSYPPIFRGRGGYQAKCVCGWRSEFVLENSTARGLFKAHREKADYSSFVYDCFACGDGVEFTDGTWDHVNDSIGVDGKRVISACEWGKPWEA